jgi:toxin-antitoxin system PIN domain toxin
MILPDVNVLIYAFRPEATNHSVCNPWLNGIVGGSSHFGISPLTLGAVIRITTNPRSYPNPSTLKDAFAFADYLLTQPHCRIIEPGERHWEIFSRLCIETDTRGGRITDAWYAALAIEWDCEWITFDRDYARFPGLRWRVPAAA